MLLDYGIFYVSFPCFLSEACIIWTVRDHHPICLALGLVHVFFDVVHWPCHFVGSFLHSSLKQSDVVSFCVQVKTILVYVGGWWTWGFSFPYELYCFFVDCVPWDFKRAKDYTCTWVKGTEFPTLKGKGLEKNYDNSTLLLEKVGI